MGDKTKLTLKNVAVVFANLDDEGFGRSLTLDASDPKVRGAITQWVKDNNIGKKEKAGVPNFKEYEGKTQYAFKINDFTRFGGLNGLSERDLGFGAQVSIVAKAFDYDNKFGKGTSGALSAILVESRAKTGADEDLASLLNDAPANDAPTPSDDDAPVDLDALGF